MLTRWECRIACGLPELMSQYRKLDDTINMRLNRTTAQFRDRERSGLGGKGDIEEQACAQIWRELIGALSYICHMMPRV